MTSTDETTLTDVHDMVVLHRAFHHEFRLIPELVRAGSPGGHHQRGPCSPSTPGWCENDACTALPLLAEYMGGAAPARCPTGALTGEPWTRPRRPARMCRACISLAAAGPERT